MKKLKFLKFFYPYRELINECSRFNCKKLIIAMLDYSERKKLPENLNKKTMGLFNEFKTVYDLDLAKSQVYGEKGSKRRWKNNKKHQNNKKTEKNNE